MKGRKNISSKQTKNSKVYILILISGITDFKTKFIINDKEGHNSVIMESIKENFMLQFSSVTQSCLTLWDPMNCSTPGLPVHHHLPEFTQTYVHRVSDAIQPSYPLSSLFLLPSTPPSIRVFSNESTLCMRWPKYWSLSFSIIPSKKIPGLISFRMDWLDLLAVQGTLKKIYGIKYKLWTLTSICQSGFMNYVSH